LTEVVKRMNKDLTDFKRIRRVKIRDEEFPKTTTQKIKRYLFEEKGLEV
jgi:long-chain acyl-CoA synthetase